VVGIESEFLQIIFDKTILGGSDLDGRCSLYRGFVVANDTVLNLSNQQPPTSAKPRSAVKINQNRNSNGYVNSRPPKNAWQEANNVEKQKIYSVAEDNMKSILGVKEVKTGSVDVKNNVSHQKKQSDANGFNIRIVKKESASYQDEKSRSGGSTLPPSQEEQMAASLKHLLNIKPTPNNINSNDGQQDTTGYVYHNFNHGQYANAGYAVEYRPNHNQHYTTGYLPSQSGTINGTEMNQSMGNYHVLNQIVSNLQAPMASSYPYQTSQNYEVPAQRVEGLDNNTESSSAKRGDNRSRGQYRGRRPWRKRGHH
jgi:hypothetical protein